ncbi:Transient-receptor-potential-like protein [Trichinella papuae]|uniref:Transient-receptor-potential-like protein n=1 Tax=Trichinella papuae TaxID=268474 RepID=A0A0V1NA80_9BILA|nr:Transient-receptor-potential-like protein [Trichinella papuae]
MRPVKHKIGRQWTFIAQSALPSGNNAVKWKIPTTGREENRSSSDVDAMLKQKERLFLEAAYKGDKATVETLLDPKDPVDINCTDLLGRTALEISVDNENVEIVELLLKQPGVKVCNALLYAIREGVFKMVEMIINHHTITADTLGDGWSRRLVVENDENFEYASDISPIILAAHLNQFEILQLLLSRGAVIKRPHSLSCSCRNCYEDRLNDSLQHSLRRINTYRALASPAWISFTSSDPVLTAFKLSWELQKLSYQECEFKELYWELSEQCKKFACDLLSQCRSSEEVIAVLNKDVSDDPIDIWSSKLSLARLRLALKYEIKQFVAHPHCQQLLTSIWYEGFPGRRQSGLIMNAFVCLMLILAWPLLSLSYIILPKSRLGQVVRAPFMKFLYYSTSFGFFLFFLTFATFESYRHVKGDSLDSRAAERGPPLSIIETLIVTWVIGMTWSEVKQLWDEGYKKYIHQWWNWLDFIMLSLYLATFALRTVAYYMVRNGNFGPETLVRTYWKSDEPVLVSESLFAVANVFSFARIIYLFQMNPYLGPLQISLGCMLIDIAKFFFLFFLILSSFAIGLVQLYWYYSPLARMCEQTDHVCLESISTFTSMADSYITLIWSLFSITNTKSTDVGERHEITQWTGRALYIAYHVTSIIVLLNMLIAMMSHSFQRINDHADLEWKFHRTQLWMGFFDEGSTLTAPFNIIITPKSGLNFLRKSYCVFKWSLGKSEWPKAKRRPTIKRPRYLQRMREVEEANEMPEPKLTYETIMQRLVSRYIHQTKKKSQMEGINEDELLEIKQDISSLRYELREERRKELARTSSNFDGIKREILRTLSSADRVYQPRTAQERGRNGIERANTNLPLRVAVPENDSAENPTTDETRTRHQLRLGRSPDRRAVEELKTSIAENVCKHMEAKMQEWLVSAFKMLETKNDQEKKQPAPSV